MSDNAGPSAAVRIPFGDGISCEQCVAYVTEYAEGALSESLRASFAAHLVKCPQCVAYLRQYEAMLRAARRSGDSLLREPETEAPAHVVDAIAKALRERR